MENRGGKRILEFGKFGYTISKRVSAADSLESPMCDEAEATFSDLDIRHIG